MEAMLQLDSTHNYYNATEQYTTRPLPHSTTTSIKSYWISIQINCLPNLHFSFTKQRKERNITPPPQDVSQKAEWTINMSCCTYKIAITFTHMRLASHTLFKKEGERISHTSMQLHIQFGSSKIEHLHQISSKWYTTHAPTYKSNGATSHPHFDSQV